MGCGFCESALSNSVGTLVVDCVVKPLGRQLDYVCRFHDNVEKLREIKGKLTMARDLLRQDIEDAERQLQRIHDVVRDMQSNADNILTDVETLEKEIGQNKRCFNWCPNWSWRYRLSKEAMKKTQDISKLLEEIHEICQRGPVGYRDESALPKIGFWCSEEFVRSKSADTASNQIMKYLKDDSITMLGLWGMGGVGKTTLACQVGDHAEKSNLFKKVVIATVSRRPNFEEIQDNIARYLDFDMKNERGIRKDVQDLWLRLKKVESILIILDDVWAYINLKERIGIPLGNDHKGCKVLLTTRRQDVCVKLGCQKVVQLGCLDGLEAFTLFAKKAGLNDSAEDDKKKLAKEIIEKCDGLPIAIVTLGSALKGQSCNEWGAACWRLKNHRLTEIQDVNEENAYLCFQESFDYLNMTTKICFLLCSLFPEDYEIYVEDLVRYAWGLKLYVCSDSVEIVRMLVRADMDNLKNSCLLLAWGERHVKMHDMVREFALWKASSKEMSFVIYSEAVETWPKDEGFEHCTAISFKSSQIADAPEGLVFPSLKILLLVGELPYRMTTSNKFFEGMKALEVCALDGIFISLAAFQFQTNLRTLLLKNCRISDFSILGKLKTLQVLSFNSSDMTELPNGIDELVNLRLLELSNCGNLQRIPRSMSRLSNLEELYLDGCSSIKWATDNATENESYSSLLELNSLPKLAVLSLDISLKQLPKGFVFGKLKKFDVCIGIRRQRWYGKGGFETCPISRSLKVETAVEACKQLFEGVESLHLTKVKTLWIDNCKEMTCATPVLKNLKELKVESCDEMQVLFQIAELRSTQQGLGHLLSLESLKVVEIYSCNKLRFLFPMSVANSLGQLKTLKIRRCMGLEEIIQATEVAEIQVQQGLNHHVSLQSLKFVEIYECNNLKYLFPTSVANSLGQLETLNIEGCLGLEEIIQATEVPDISLQSLKKVHVERCGSLTSLSSLSHGQSLENLIKLVIRDCDRLEYTFPISMAKGLPQLNKVCLVNLPQFKGGDGNDIVLSLRSLRSLQVHCCPQLIPFTISVEIQVQQGLKHHVSFQSLKFVEIKDCDNLKYLFPTSVANSLGQLETLKIKRWLGLEEIIQATEVAEVQVQQGLDDHLSFRSLKVVKIYRCNHLKYLFPKSVANSLGQLETLKIKSCLELEEIIQATEVAEVQVQQGLNRHPSFQSVKFVEIDSCNNLKCLFPTSVANSLGHLERLKIKSCLGLEEIIQATTVSDTCLQSLRFVEIDSCNNLKYLFPDICLQSLCVVEIDSCNNLKSLFPTSVANSLGQLEILKIKSCLGLEEIIQATTVSDTCLQRLLSVEIDSCNNLKYLFPTSVANSLGRLGRLEIKSCLGLEEIIQATTVSDTCLQRLWSVEIDSCNNLKYLFPTSVANSLGQLETLTIKSCLGLEVIIQATEVPDISLQSLREVHVEKCDNLTSLSSLSHGQSLENLIELVIQDCDRLEYTFPISMAEGLPQLNEVCLVNLPQFEGSVGNDIVLSLRSLRVLKVHGCPQLIPLTISAEIRGLELGGTKERKQMCNMIVPELKGRSADMEYLTITNFEDLFDSGYNLSSMRTLRLEALPELRVIWKDPFQVVNFQNLTGLEVYDCRRLRYIFSPTIASNLPQLSSLKVFNCEELEQIIEKDQTSSQYHHLLQPICFPNLIQISIRNCENLKCLFPISVAHCGLPKLQFLSLVKLSNLVSFSPVGYHFFFPFLDRLEINDCPNITTSFSVDSKQSVHVKTEASQSVDGIIVEEEEAATTHGTTWPIGSDILWPYGDEEESEAEI